MIDYLQLQGSTENPTFVTILFTLFLTFILSSLLAFTFEKTSKDILVPVLFLQSLILVSIVAATVMQAIGDSLARGLGMLGALAIIRFRTTLKTPRNMVFTFASLAAGISCGVYGYVIGIVGTVGFCIIAFILKYSPMSSNNKLVGTFKFELPKYSVELAEVEMILAQYCAKFHQIKFQIGSTKKKKDIVENESDLPSKWVAYEYKIALKEECNAVELDSAFATLKSIRSLLILFETNTENV